MDNREKNGDPKLQLQTPGDEQARREAQDNVQPGGQDASRDGARGNDHNQHKGHEMNIHDLESGIACLTVAPEAFLGSGEPMGGTGGDDSEGSAAPSVQFGGSVGWQAKLLPTIPPIPMPSELPSVDSTSFDPEEVGAWWDRIILPEHCVELRAMADEYGIVSGLFNDRQKFIDACHHLHAKMHVYSTVNPVPVDFMGRKQSNCLAGNWKATKNRLVEVEIERVESIKDRDIVLESWFFLDVDPIRPSGVSATNEERRAAEEVARRIQMDFTNWGVQSELLSSGNGYYVLIRLIPRPANPELRKRVLDRLVKRYGTEKAHVDEKVANLSRILRVPGTLNIKGASNKEIGRVHHLARFVDRDTMMDPCDFYSLLPDEITDSDAPPPPAGTAIPSPPPQPTPPKPPRSRTVAHDAPSGEVPAGDAAKLARAYLAEVPGAVSGKNGHTNTFRVAMLLAQDFGLPRSSAKPLLEVWNEKCEPPWSPDELVHKLDDAYDKLNPGLIGCKLKVRKDRRAETSPQNGQIGGRPSQDYRGMAVDIQRHFDEAGRIVRQGRGRTWKFNGQFYEDVSEPMIRGLIMQQLQARDDVSHTKYTVDNVLENLGAPGFWGLTGVPKRSSFWMDPHGNCEVGREVFGDADDWVVMNNCLVNVGALTRCTPENIQSGLKSAAMEHTSELFAMRCLGYAYDPDAKCPRWEQYMEEVQPDTKGRQILQMLAGLALVPDLSYNVFFVLYGDPGCGKSVFLHVLKNLVGSGNCCAVPLPNFRDKYTSHMLTEALLNIVGDTDEHSGESLKSVEGVLKSMTDGEMITVERKYCHPETLPVTARNVFATNTMPHFTDRTDGLWDRLRIVPFNVKFRGTDKEKPNLREDILVELPGIFNWAANGLVMLRGYKRFPEHPEGVSLKEMHQLNCNRERAFLDETCEHSPDDAVEAKMLYDGYRVWMNSNGNMPRNSNNFYQEVERVYGCKKKEMRRKHRKGYFFEGIRLRAADRAA